MAKPKPWRVRVRMAQEGWVEVIAESALEAELLAANHINVIHVFAKSAIPGDQPANRPIPQGIEDE